MIPRAYCPIWEAWWEVGLLAVERTGKWFVAREHPHDGLWLPTHILTTGNTLANSDQLMAGANAMGHAPCIGPSK